VPALEEAALAEAAAACPRAPLALLVVAEGALKGVLV
jgi:hypothetical protein